MIMHLPAVHKIFLNLLVTAILLLIVYALYSADNGSHPQQLQPEPLDVAFIFTKADVSSNLYFKTEKMLSSLTQHTTHPINFHVITDENSKKVLQKLVNNTQVYSYDVTIFAKELKTVIEAMQPFFSSQPGAYYSDALFFLSTGLHRLLHLNKIVLVDVDTRFDADVAVLYKHFGQFTDDNVIGIGPEMSPVYRHVLYSYRNKHPETSYGSPPPDGFPGFNSGVLLLNLERMRASKKYNNLLNSTAISEMAEKYIFKGHLGDQDFYTLVGMEYPELIYPLPCNWNRQLCEWWKKHGYEKVFSLYNTCEGNIALYHANCNTNFPDP